MDPFDLVECKDVIEKQAKLLDLSMAKKSEYGASQQMYFFFCSVLHELSLRPCAQWMHAMPNRRTELRQGMQVLEDERRQLEEERQKLSDAALRMGKERGFLQVSAICTNICLLSREDRSTITQK